MYISVVNGAILEFFDLRARKRVWKSIQYTYT